MKSLIKVREIGLISAIFLVLSNMLGSGVFLLPSVLAKIGGITIFGWFITMVGVIALALVFAKFSEIMPNGSGPYSYVRNSLGNFLGYQTNLSYSIAAWIGNISMLSVIVGYLTNIFPIFENSLYAFIIQVSLIWTFIFLNIYGAKIVSIIQSSALLLAVSPMLIIITVGWFYFDFNLFMQSWNMSNQSPIQAINLSFNPIMWAFIGIESACVSANVIKNPKRNIPLATILGIFFATLLYVGTVTVIMGVVPNSELINSGSPFADAFEHMFGRKIGNFISIFAIINCLGALAGWTLVIGQTAKAASLDGLFPKIFSKVNGHGVPKNGLIIIAVIMSFISLLTISKNINQQFNQVVSISVILYLIPYVYCGFAMFLVSKDNLYKVFGLISALFCFWSIYNSGSSYLVMGFVFLLMSVLLYTFNEK